MRMRSSVLNLQDDVEKKSGELRLQVYLARCGVASRRSSEQIIQSGRVSVNGHVVTEMGVKVHDGDSVSVDGRRVEPENSKRYVLLNKPQGYVCSLSDEKGRPVAADLLKEKYSERLYNVGRLDMFSKGLIIFTNDGDFAARLSHPSAELEKEYIVESSMDIPDSLPADFERGIRIDNVFYRCRTAEKINVRKMRVILIEGKNREIRHVFENAGLGIKSLARVRIGSVLIGDMRPGEFRNLTDAEVKSLIALCGRKVF